MDGKLPGFKATVAPILGMNPSDTVLSKPSSSLRAILGEFPSLCGSEAEIINSMIGSKGNKKVDEPARSYIPNVVKKGWILNRKDTSHGGKIRRLGLKIGFLENPCLFDRSGKIRKNASGGEVS